MASNHKKSNWIDCMVTLIDAGATIDQIDKCDLVHFWGDLADFCNKKGRISPEQL
jgi:hypothetical protein